MNDFELWSVAGFTPELLPIIPPGARISPNSSLFDPREPVSESGKCPGIYDARRADWRGMRRWSEHTASIHDVNLWSRWAPTPNVGMQARNFPAFDIDVDDPELARAVRENILWRLGPAPTRTRSNSPRCLLMYRCADPGAKVIAKHQAGTDAVELLHSGNQYVVAGQHGSGSSYHWDRPPVAAQLTYTQRGSLVACLRGLASLGFVVKGATACGTQRHAGVAIDPGAPDYYASALGIDTHGDSNSWISTRCPFHEDNRPSLSVNIHHGGFRCHACNVYGSSTRKFAWLLAKVAEVSQ